MRHTPITGLYASHIQIHPPSLASDKELYTRIKAYRDGNVYGSNSSESYIFEEVTFPFAVAPRDFISILHPELSSQISPGLISKRWLNKFLILILATAAPVLRPTYFCLVNIPAEDVVGSNYRHRFKA